MTTVREPGRFSEVIEDPRWVEAMNEEMQALNKKETWDLIPFSPHRRQLVADGCITPMVLSIKIRLGSSQKGYVKTHGVDYEEIVASVAKIMTIWTVIAYNNQRVAPPSNGSKEHISSRRIRRGVHGTTSRFQVEHTPTRGMPTQKASLQP